MDIFAILQPDSAKIDFSSVFERYQQAPDALHDYIDSITYPKYLPWEKARFKTPPNNFTSEEAWYLGRILRTVNASELPVRAQDGTHFSWARLNYTDRLLNEFDLLIGGHQIMSNKVRFSASEHQRYMARGIIEEAIASSQLEGASVTRKDAKAMIAEKRTPRDHSEWMTYNNYRMMQKITDTYKDVPLSLELLLDMHQIVAKNTMEADEIGRFRIDADNIVVGSETEITYVPPKETQLLEELPRLIAFANDDNPEHFIHPIIKAIVLHFWIGLLHPFADGNGRIARAIFYWYLLKKDYWLATYIPISTVIKRAPMQYSDAYVYTEQDHYDFTYFFDYHMKKIKIALDEFLTYVETQHEENKAIDRLIDSRGQLNERQKQVVHYLTSDPKHRVSITSHRGLNNISLNTARRDLFELQKLGLVFSHRQGKYVFYYSKPLS